MPIIDVVRHGPTDYRELRDEKFTFDPDAADFALDAEHLDLTEKGIRKITETAERLAGMIDKDNEAIMLITSPQARARSSMLVIEKVLSEHGIEILNPGTGVKQSERGLSQIPQRNPVIGKQAIEMNMKLRAEQPEWKNLTPEELDEAVAQRLGIEVSDMFSKSREEVGEEFKRFLRHAVNIDQHLSDATKERIGGKRLRIVCVTHEERLNRFARQALNIDRTVHRAQMMEVRPEAPLTAGGEITADVTLYDSGETADRSAQVTIRFAKESGT